MEAVSFMLGGRSGTALYIRKLEGGTVRIWIPLFFSKFFFLPAETSSSISITDQNRERIDAFREESLSQRIGFAEKPGPRLSC